MRLSIRGAALVVLGLAIATVPARSAEEVLLGKVRPSSLPSITESWEKDYNAYEPSPEDIRTLATLDVPADLDVYFGSWCGDSRRELPHLVKILDRASLPGLRVRYFGLDRTKTKPARLARRGSIERVPTIVLSVAGQEIGRIVESPRTSLEHDLALLVGLIPRESARDRTGP